MQKKLFRDDLQKFLRTLKICLYFVFSLRMSLDKETIISEIYEWSSKDAQWEKKLSECVNLLISKRPNVIISEEFRSTLKHTILSTFSYTPIKRVFSFSVFSYGILTGIVAYTCLIFLWWNFWSYIIYIDIRYKIQVEWLILLTYWNFWPIWTLRNLIRV